jgi:predicted dehydrogenase/threonine dehydrogenase-like Zn-dependent dehydrogenase
MQQLTQQLKSGKMEILDVPFPALNKGQILVRNHFSVISAGTEGKTVTDARKGYIAKARSRQKEVKQVIGMIKTEGLKKTYDVVMNKLEAPSPLGYSSAGEVIAVGDDITDFKVGDKVACGGGGAYHADVVAVNRNLCVKLPANTDLSQAAFATIASIAIQGIRQADLRFGENCTVIGLGLIGLITIEVLKASGIKAIGVDVSEAQVEKAKEIGADLVLNRNHNGIAQTILDFTNGNGTDAVIITAGTSSLDPVEFAGEICRRKGKVVIVGAVPTGFSRPNYYKKELDLRMSSSYGPGRYDPVYEEKGIDYPIGYVRFTENRNMQTYIDLLAAGKLNIKKLITHTFNLHDSPDAYDLILNRKEQLIGVLIRYDATKEVQNSVLLKNNAATAQNATNVGFIGAGNFAQNAVLPRIKDKVNFIGIATGEGNMSRYVAEKYAFNYCVDTPEKLIQDDSIGTVFVLTRHDTHAEYVVKSLKAGKNVYVEKPLAMNFEELEEVKTAYQNSGKGLMLGFNRRFSPLMQQMMSALDASQKKSINIRVNAGVVPPDHWVHDPKVGGGRIIGEVCHFIDLAYFIAGSKAKSIHAFALGANPTLNDTVSINIEFDNGSIANISYYSNGNKYVPKERIEVFSNGAVYSIDDFKTMETFSEKGVKKTKLKAQDKGHSASFDKTIQSLKNGDAFPIAFEEIFHSTLLTLQSIKSIKEKRTIWIKEQ